MEEDKLVISVAKCLYGSFTLKTRRKMGVFTKRNGSNISFVLFEKTEI